MTEGLCFICYCLGPYNPDPDTVENDPWSF